MSPNPWLECPNPDPTPCPTCGAEDGKACDPGCPGPAPQPVVVVQLPKKCPH